MTSRRTAASVTAAAAAAVFLLGSCGGDRGAAYQSPYRSFLEFEQWDSLAIGTCRGVIRNTGPKEATQVSAQVWYASTLGETSLVVVPNPDRISGTIYVYPEELYGYAKFVVPPQETGGELRYPRVGAITWDAGVEPAQSRTPELVMPGSWEWIGPDSARFSVHNRGGWAYHVTLTVENRDGERAIRSVPETIGFNRRAAFVSVARDSAGVALLPRFKKLRWEDYGGVRDSLGPP